MINLSLLLIHLFPQTRMEIVVTEDTALLTALLFIAVIVSVGYLIVRNYKRKFDFGMNTFRENFDREKMLYDRLQNEFSTVQVKLSDLEKEKVSWSDEKQKLLKTISDLEEQVKNPPAQSNAGPDDIIIEYYMNQSSIGQSPASPS